MRNTNYNDNSLFIAINKERTRFVVLFYKDLINKTYACFPFKKSDSVYEKFMFTDLDIFMKQVEIFLDSASFYVENDITSKYLLRENESLKRLQDKCSKLKLSFRRQTTQSSCIDCVINNYNIQHKTTNCKPKRYKYCYNIMIQKNAGCINGKYTRQPYSNKDNIDFFIFEIINFPNNFYVIPMNIMIEKGYVKTENACGKKCILVSQPNKNKEHWTNQYLNNFDQLK